MPGQITVLAGTTKGLFLLQSADRTEWTVRGPLCDGWPINHAIGDPDTGRMWAAGGDAFQGAGVWTSTDGGETWELSLFANGQFDEMLKNDPDIAAYVGKEAAPPAPFTGDVEALWSLGRSDGKLYAGAKPAALYESADGGATWARVDGLSEHPSRETWQPGAAGLVLHSIVADPGVPKKLWVGISAAGVFATEDGGRTWDQRNRRSNEEAPQHGHAPGHDHGADVGLCVHNFVRADAGRRSALPAEPPRRVPQRGWRAKLGRCDGGAAFVLRFPHRGASARPRDGLGPAAQRRHRGALPARRLGRGLAVARRGADVDRVPGGAARAELLLHGAAAGDGDGPGPRRPASTSGRTAGRSSRASTRATLARDRAASADGPVGRDAGGGLSVSSIG